MTAEHDDLLSCAAQRLDRISGTLAAHRLSVREYQSMLVGADAVLAEARRWITTRAGASGWLGSDPWAGTPTAEVNRGPLQCIRTARRGLRSSTGALSSATDPAAAPFADAVRLMGLARDRIRGHFDADGAPLTDQGRIASTPGGHLVVLARVGEVCAGTAGALRDVAAASPAEVLGDRPQLNEGARVLDQAASLIRAATAGAPARLDALVTAPVLTPVALSADETPRVRLRLIAESCERLRAGIDRAVRRPDTGPGMSGSDLVDTARSLALAHLLAGRLIHAVGSAAVPDGDDRAALAGSFRQTAQALRATAEGWTRIVDIGDPRAAVVAPLPTEPPTGGYVWRRSGRSTQLPRPPAHPAVTEAELLAVRVGRLLFTDDWRPERPASAVPRPIPQLLADLGSPSRLLTTLSRLPATAHTLTTHASRLIARLSPGLVTNDAAHRPVHLQGPYHWFPASPAQLATLSATYTTAAEAAHQTAVFVDQTADALPGPARPRVRTPQRTASREPGAAMTALPPHPQPRTSLTGP